MILISFMSIYQSWMFLAFVTFSEINQAAHASCMKPQLELMVTPPDSMKDHRGNTIRIYWRFNTTYSGAWIGLYSQEPVKSSDEFLLSNKIPVVDLSGYETTFFYVESKLTQLKYDQPTYLGYTAVAWTNKTGKDEAIVITKLQTYPQWMKHYWKFIKDVPIRQLFLPGTHDTSSFTGDLPSEETNTFSAKIWSILKKLTPLDAWSLTQNRTIKEQLVSGIRYLDIRAMKDGDDYWVCHAAVLMHPMDEIINDIIEFVTSTEKEIVIFDIHYVGSGLKSDEHQEAFINYLKGKFTPNSKKLYVSPKSMAKLWNSTLEQIVAEGKIIISYINDDFRKKNDFDVLWPSVFQYWGNKQTVTDLKDYIYATIPARKLHDDNPSILTSVMAELTANIKSMTDDMKDSLPVQAFANSIEIHDWFLDPNVAEQTNVLAVDFFETSGVVRLAFIWNERKYFKSECDAKDTINDDYYQKVLIP